MLTYLSKVLNTSYKTLFYGSLMEKIAFLLKLLLIIGPTTLVMIICSTIGYTTNNISVILIPSAAILFVIILIYCVIWEYVDSKKHP